ncbi:hypothetical protein VNO77_41960 [Canavalia gladiata]|uniref:Uncharacterized protein n=1 Tax=Canavalia gladiata TaxID=3824 RepID=A0AAN9PSY2_CANGL
MGTRSVILEIQLVLIESILAAANHSWNCIQVAVLPHFFLAEFHLQLLSFYDVFDFYLKMETQILQLALCTFHAIMRRKYTVMGPTKIHTFHPSISNSNRPHGLLRNKY